MPNLKQKSIYLAVLNQGEIRTDLTQVLNMLIQHESYRIHLSYPTAKPISNNRNMIVSKFLATDCDYLMMIDSDIIPPMNILQLADFDKDIITPLMFVYQKGMLLPLFLKKNKDGIYDVDNYLEKTGLQKIDATGTGCIIIKRKVLEHPALKYPFRNEYDADGIKTRGLDLNFCSRAKEVGFDSWVHLDYLADHHSTLSLKELFFITVAKYKMEKQLHDIKKRNLKLFQETLDL
jgi:hypothetical protein